MIFAIIPARSGSKAVKDKNVALVGGYPLIAYSIAAAILSKSIDRVILSTDSEDYASLGRRYGAETPFLRPKMISDDHSTDLDFMRHAIDWFQNQEGRAPDYWVHLRPTTPLRNSKLIDEAISQFISFGEATSLRSAHRAPESPHKWFQKRDAFYYGLIDAETSSAKLNDPRAAFPAAYIPDGYVDVINTHHVMEKGDLHGGKILAYESPVCVEVDTHEELDLIRYQIEKKGSPLLDYLQKNFEKET